MNQIETVKLTKKEQATFDAICWDLDELERRDDAVDHLKKMGQLAESLLKRKVVPKVRLDYFTQPEMNIGGYGKSRRQVFEANGTSGSEILCHPHFMQYLRYFIYGPDLPKDTIQGFCKIIEDDAGTSGMVLDQIKAFVRREMQTKGLDRSQAAEEFFKLAHEIGKPNLADSVRSAAKSVRK